MNPGDRGWGRGWPSCDVLRSGLIVVAIGGINRVRLPVHRRLALPSTVLVQRLEADRGRGFNPAWCWGGACRNIAGTDAPSFHSWWTALDLDAPENPKLSAAAHAAPHPLRRLYHLSTGPRYLRSTMGPNVERICADLGFRWGGTYTTSPDTMHVEFVGTPADADALTVRLAAELRALAAAGAPPTPTAATWKVRPMFDPPLVLPSPMVAWCPAPGGVLWVTADGHVGALGAHSYGEPFGHDYWRGRYPSEITANPADFTDDERGAGVAYVIVATSEERYAYRPT